MVEAEYISKDPNFRKGTDLSKFREEISRILKVFIKSGADEVELPILLNADVLLDLYGEDLRARSFSTKDPVYGEKILRPDFTVPVAQMHISREVADAKYAYSGPVWRLQTSDSENPREYFQVGFELFHKGSRSIADAEAFKLIHEPVSKKGLECETGDVGVIRSIVEMLDVSLRRKEMLLKHLWRPHRFKELINLYSDNASYSEERKKLLKAAKKVKLRAHINKFGDSFGVRSREDIESRALELLEESMSAPISKSEITLIRNIQFLNCKLVDVSSCLSTLGSQESCILKACDRISERTENMAMLGIDVRKLPFSGSFLRSSMEYYDGFIFGFYIPGKAQLPAVAQGGRYDALTNILGRGKSTPAVGGIIRPDLSLIS